MLAVPGGGGGLGAERDRQVRLHSVTTDLALDLPPSIPLPDGEEIPYGSSTRLHIRDTDQVSIEHSKYFLISKYGTEIAQFSKVFVHTSETAPD
ncbi:unnamed protein product [Nesidiocoris tenuis]|uniref:Uncharacterized protein n=1 Tax=Nesidiocoris tenuis TaxID=355587 RepID=A0A6H5H8D9_9HEMI|nr:unnamed protein product [Nesidiocoris tenuis]